MKKITFLLLMTLSLFVFNSCGDEVDNTEDINYVSFENTAYTFGVDLASTTSRDIKVYTTQVSGSDRTFNVKVDLTKSTADPASYTVPASVTIPANSNVGVLPVSITDLNIGEAGKKLVLVFEPAEGLLYGAPITLNIKQVCPLNEVILTINFDSYPDETSWKLFNSTGAVITSGGPYDGQTKLIKAFCLANGTYTFTIYDLYGDGIAPGTYQLVYNGAAIKAGGVFGVSESTTFTVNK
ncbi:MAG: hypothetical protein GZ086_05210 [Gelidibacter sp.]|nr:hypothetical protein [Gelidibacter sp.]